MERKLTAILCADVFGYSRLMGEDEEATLRTLSSYRKLIDSLIEQHHGRFVNSAGDSVLAEFASVVNAVQCAVEIQTTLKAENANLPPERRMEFRIGVNLGDVMVDGEQIYGDGVNVAARLESLAQPGGICISGKVHDEIRSKLALGYEDLGAQTVKNIAEPLRVYRVLPETGVAEPTADMTKEQATRKYARRGVFSVAGFAFIAAVIILVQHLSLRPPVPSASIPSVQSPALTLPDEPSIAVLPFTNMSGDREQEYFSDGITDDLITALSRLPDLFVIARTSTFTYKSKPAKVQDISRELGVKYILEGSVRKEANEVRITAQLVDAASGDHLWAAHYDRPLKDIFSLQDEIVRRIVTTLKLRINSKAWKGVDVLSQHTDNLDAYDDYLRGVKYAWGLTENGDVNAKRMFEKAIELDPTYADAYGALGYMYFFGWLSQWSEFDPNALDRAIKLEQQAIALDDGNALTHALLGRLYMFNRQYDKAIAEGRQALDLAPNFGLAYFFLGDTLGHAGKLAESIGLVEKAERLDPRNRDLYEYDIAVAYALMGRYGEAIPILKATNPNIPWKHVWLATVYSELDRQEEARAEAAEVLRISPHFSLKQWQQRLPYEDPAVSERCLANLRKAGLN
jgi:adenylate cyclase